jgi:ribose/xylose/arabinose/galactoside ABC-type transport system permease subunit
MTTITPPSEQTPLPLEYHAHRQTRDWVSILSALGPFIGLVFVIILFSSLRYDTFFRISNFELIFRQTAVVGTGALGMTLIIIAGGIDLSVGSAIALVTVSIGLFLPHNISDPDTGERSVTRGVSAWLAALGGIGVGTLCGVMTGTLVTRLKLIPFIITLGMMSILRGLAQRLASNSMVYPNAEQTEQTFLAKLLQPLSPDHLWLLTPGVWLMLVLAILVAAMLRYTRFGRHIFAIGSNEQTARLCGVPIERTKLFVYMLGAALAAVAGVLQFSYLGMGDPTTANGMELDIIAAVVIGGASLNGGQGTITGSLIGALIMSVVSNGCNKMGLENNVQLIVTGSIIILAVALDRLRHRRAT